MGSHASASGNPRDAELPVITLSGDWSWERILRHPATAPALAARIGGQRWFGSKSRVVASIEPREHALLAQEFCLALVQVKFQTGTDEIYQIPLGFATGESAKRLTRDNRDLLWARVERDAGQDLAVLYDSLVEPEFSRALVEWFDAQASLPARRGAFVAWQSPQFADLRGDAKKPLAARAIGAEQSNRSLALGERLVLKLFGRVEAGLNPDVEICEHLTRCGFPHVPPLAGAIEYRPSGAEPWSLGVLQGFVANQGDAWHDILRRLGSALAIRPWTTGQTTATRPSGGLVAAAGQPIPSDATREFGEFLPWATHLGRRTAELHAALAAAANEHAFAPEPFSPVDQRIFADQAIRLTRETFALLREHAPRAAAARLIDEVLGREAQILAQFEQFAAHAFDVCKIRCHGDYHLGQVLAAGDDFVIIDFEGEPARLLHERRQKQLAARDVAGMIRSFHYAAGSAAAAARAQFPANVDEIGAWTQAWYHWTGTAFLAAYRDSAGDAVFVPRTGPMFERILAACLLEKAVYELRYELNNRPDWLPLPLGAIGDLVDAAERPASSNDGVES